MLADKHRADFLLDFENHTFCNHGSYGAAPKVVCDRKNELLMEMESHPDTWFRKTALPRYIECCKAAADFVHAAHENITIVRNTTQGIQAVMNCFPNLKKCLINSHTYNAMKNTVDMQATRTGCKYVSVDIPMPIDSEDQIVELFVQKMESEGDIDFAIIDHISSASALVFPIKRLVMECRKRNIIVCIDGAHAPGQIDLHLDDLDADFYAGNFHKWAYATRGCALLWTNPKYHKIMEPLTTSHLYKGSLHEKFYQQGTDDQSNFFALPVALEYHKSMGFDALYKNAEELLEYARKKLCDEVGCEMYPVPSSMEAPFMKIVKLPKSEKVPIPDITITDKLVVEILNVHNTVIAITTSNGHIWMRISCNCYNTFADYDRLVAVIKMVVSEML